MFSFHPVANFFKIAQAYLQNELASILLRPLQLIANETIRNNFLNEMKQVLTMNINSLTTFMPS